VTRLTVVTVSVVPAGIVAAFNDEAATQAHVIAIIVMSLCGVILVCMVDFLGFNRRKQKK
jgi:hypothetical protein